MSRPRTMIVGVDGGTFDLIDPLVCAGHLPAMKHLMAMGVRGPLRTWPDMNSEAGWSGLITGCNPGQHGIYGLVTDTLDDSQLHVAKAVDRRKDPFWRILSSAGLGVGVINVPLTYPADPINGFMLSGMHTPHIRSPGFAHPPGLADELRRQGFGYIIDLPSLPSQCYRDPQRAVRSAQRMVDARSRAVLYLMRTRPWDVLLAVFTVTDVLQHFFWPDEHAAVEGGEWAPLRSIYQQIDAFLGDARKLIDENTTVLVVSDHGFGPVQPARQCLNRLFEQLGLLRHHESGKRPRRLWLENLLGYGRQLAPQRIQKFLAQAFPRLHGRALHESRYSGIDWSHTVAYAGPYGSNIRINLEGREAEGAVSAEEYHSTRESVRDILLNLTDPATGRHVVQAVHRREDVYRGPYAENAADLLVEWQDELVGDALCYWVDGEPIIVRTPEDSPTRRVTGSHTPEGIMIGCGPHIRGGETVENAHIYDIAPTILYLHDQPIPGDMDGVVLTGIFTDEQLARHPVRRSEPAEVGVGPSEKVLGAEEGGDIEERSRGTGAR